MRKTVVFFAVLLTLFLAVAALFASVGTPTPEKLGEAFTRVAAAVTRSRVARTIVRAKPAPMASSTPIELGRLATTTVMIPPAWTVKARSVTGKALLAPDGWTVSVYAAGIDKARMLAVDASGTAYVTAIGEGMVYALPDLDRDAVADAAVPIARALRKPSGIVWHDGWLYVAEEDRVERMRTDGGERSTLIRDIPKGGEHVTRTLAIRDGTLFVSVGSSCNACKDDPRRAAVLAYDLDGTHGRVYASGLRNSVGLVVGPDGKLWGTDNGRDFLGDDVPPDEVNVIEDGGDYGWPYCYGDRVVDPSFGTAARCASTRPPEVAIQAHDAPLGLRFLDDAWGTLAGGLVVAAHGSWNRSMPTGYALLLMSREAATSTPSAAPWRVQTLVTGWRAGEADAWGRPVDMIAIGPRVLLVTDDKANLVYAFRAPW